ncbi:hypothetical protein PSYAR_27926, partial [Pseudomonas syringae pv. aceris str. M302273]
MVCPEFVAGQVVLTNGSGGYRSQRSGFGVPSMTFCGARGRG